VRYDTDGTPHFYTPKGDSLRRLFLKSPLRFARVTSGFSQGRFHPILRVRRPHMGIDYGAPRGTPVMAVGDGEVSVAARRGASGNMIALKHTSSYETMYKHLSRFADGIKPGAKVSSGQIIGYVGATGRATGPHLHFELHVNGRYVDPAAIAFPAADPVPATDLDKFRLVSSKAVASLPAWSSEIISTAALRRDRLAE
jgi:murein DD-endopeptidase MepM/ murein hydrolase activator NlpD